MPAAAAGAGKIDNGTDVGSNPSFNQKHVKRTSIIKERVKVMKISRPIRNLTTGPWQGRGETGSFLGRQFLGSAKIDNFFLLKTPKKPIQTVF